MPLTRAHFSDEEWTDYVRGILPPAQRAALQAHLDETCAACLKMHATWAAILQTAGPALLDEPPEHAMRIAKALFAVRQPEEGRGGLAAQLLFDSGLATATGFRAATAVSRKYVFAVGKYLVDIQLQDDEKGQPTQLIGQVTPQEGTDPDLEGSPVLLLREMKVIARATMNRLGEFHLDFDGYAVGMSLALGLARGGTVIRLDMARNEQ